MGLIRDTILVSAATFVAGAGLMEIGDESNESLKSKVLPYIGTFLAGGLGYYFLRETKLIQASEYQPNQEFEDYSPTEIANSSAIQGFEPFKYSVVGNRAEEWFYDVSFEAEAITPPKPPLNVRWNEPKTDEEKEMCNPTMMITNLLTAKGKKEGYEGEILDEWVNVRIPTIIRSESTDKVKVLPHSFSQHLRNLSSSRSSGNYDSLLTSEGIFEYDGVHWALFKFEDWPFYKRRGYGPKIQDTYFVIEYNREGEIDYRKQGTITEYNEARKRKWATLIVKEKMNAMYKPRYALDPSEVMLEQMGILDSTPLLSPFRLKIKNKRRGLDPTYTHRYSIFGAKKEGSMTELFRWELTNDSSKQQKPADIMKKGINISPGFKAWMARKPFKDYQRLALLDPANFTMRRINLFNESIEEFYKVQDPLLLAVVTEQGGMIPEVRRLSRRRYEYHDYKPPFQFLKNIYNKKQFEGVIQDESDDEGNIWMHNESVISYYYGGSRYYNINDSQKMEVFVKGVKTLDDFKAGIVKDLFTNQVEYYQKAYERGGLLAKNKDEIAKASRLLLKRKTALLKEASGDSGKA